jgi:hypothetical protein
VQRWCNEKGDANCEICQQVVCVLFLPNNVISISLLLNIIDKRLKTLLIGITCANKVQFLIGSHTSQTTLQLLEPNLTRPLLILGTVTAPL